jgi:hypothetical protein
MVTIMPPRFGCPRQGRACAEVAAGAARIAWTTFYLWMKHGEGEESGNFGSFGTP